MFVGALLLVAGSCALPELTIDRSLDDEDEENDDSSGGRSGGNGGSGASGGTSGGDQGGKGGASGGTDGKGGASGGTDGKGGASGGTAGKGGSATGGGPVIVCPGGQTNCSGTCVNTNSDGAHCGACNTFCGASADCTNGVCVCKTLVGPMSYLLIDDLEDGDNIVGNERDPPLRVGYWYTFNDEYDDGTTSCSQYPTTGEDATFTPNCGNATCETLLPTPNGSRAAAHMAGGGCLEWGAGMGFDFGSCNERPSPYDARAYIGIRFWYRSTTSFRVTVGMIADIPTTDGGTCIRSVPTDCYNHHGARLPASTAGTPVEVLFRDLSQEFGTTRPFDPTQLANLQFQADANEQPFDLWIDEISFMP
jgi:hypothetical protein